MDNRYAAEMGCGQPPPGEEGGAKNPAVLSGKSCELASFVCVATRFIAEARKASMHAQYGRRRGITRGNRSESATRHYVCSENSVRLICRISSNNIVGRGVCVCVCVCVCGGGGGGGAQIRGSNVSRG